MASQIAGKTSGPGTILSKELFSEAKTKLEALDKKDAERWRTTELKNNLEEYIYSTREKLEDNEEIVKVSTERQRQSFTEKLSEVQEWLYTDGEDAAANEFKEHLDSLKAIGNPIFFRLNELTARPAACGNARAYLGKLKREAQQTLCREGMKVNCGCMSHFFINNSGRKICELNEPFIMLFTRRLSRIDIPEECLTLAKKSRRPLLIIVEDINLDVLIGLIHSKRHGAEVCVARALGNEEHQRRTLEDIAVLTHSTLLTEHFCMNVKLELDMLGSCESVIVSEGKTYIRNAVGNEKAIAMHYNDLISGLASCTTEQEQQNILQRLYELLEGLPPESAFRKMQEQLREAGKSSRCTACRW